METINAVPVRRSSIRLFSNGNDVHRCAAVTQRAERIISQLATEQPKEQRKSSRSVALTSVILSLKLAHRFDARREGCLLRKAIWRAALAVGLIAQCFAPALLAQDSLEKLF